MPSLKEVESIIRISKAQYESRMEHLRNSIDISTNQYNAIEEERDELSDILTGIEKNITAILDEMEYSRIDQEAYACQLLESVTHEESNS